MGTTMTESSEKPIDPKTYRFRWRKKAKPEEQQTVKRTVSLTPETHQRILNYARRSRIGFSKAVEKLLDTEESRAMEPIVTIDWDKVRRMKLGNHYMSIDLFRSGNRRRYKQK
jgi:macrodomain Ter protein organizer (MatP/YcbG family)